MFINSYTVADVNEAFDQKKLRNFDPSSLPYRETIGALLYLTTGSRPNISFSVSVLYEKVKNPKEEDRAAVKRVFRYLKGSVRICLLYKSSCEDTNLSVYRDADYAGDPVTRRSSSGILCMYAGGVVVWSSQKQRSVVLSTTEAEYVAASEATKDAIWANRLLSVLIEISEIPTLFVDNASAVKLRKNPDIFTKPLSRLKFEHFREKLGMTTV
ncbi:hypothetical protein Zmor_006141 [Zophobas morio]|uniref:Copia protein n=1 Tax=Zophobas morio TaxID=2755281 RepID=A0AA38IUF2_9CUCU|nr:hypothetical protein Zmor_006141 [Zophobas morio]